jgi:hypothetical protein
MWEIDSVALRGSPLLQRRLTAPRDSLAIMAVAGIGMAILWARMEATRVATGCAAWYDRASAESDGLDWPRRGGRAEIERSSPARKFGEGTLSARRKKLRFPLPSSSAN